MNEPESQRSQPDEETSLAREKQSEPPTLNSAGERDLAELNVIRSAVAFTRLPFHQLSKKADIDIRIIQRSRTGGQIDLYWKVIPNAEYGPPRSLAYRLDTVIINERLSKLGRPLPRIVRLGSLRAIARELGLGGDTNKVKLALRQNALTGITAKVKYKTEGGGEQTIDATFNRYNFVIRGGEIDGEKVDAVYLIFNDPYYAALRNSPVRPLDHDYLKALAPGPQRFYELLSFHVFPALKYNLPYARLVYSEYCRLAPQARYYSRQPVQNQMNALHRQHIRAGYIAKVQYQATTDAEGKPDWIILYTPGEKAWVEYGVSQRKRHRIATGPSATPRLAEAGEHAVHSRSAHRIDPSLLSELTGRGITETRARALIGHLLPGQAVQDQLEWGDHLISIDPARFLNPAGFYVHLISENVVPPETFETSLRRKQREDVARARAHEEAERLSRQAAAQRVDEERLAALSTEARDRLYQEVRAELLAKSPFAAEHSEGRIFKASIRYHMLRKLDGREPPAAA